MKLNTSVKSIILESKWEMCKWSKDIEWIDFQLYRRERDIDWIFVVIESDISYWLPMLKLVILSEAEN